MKNINSIENVAIRIIFASMVIFVFALILWACNFVCESQNLPTDTPFTSVIVMLALGVFFLLIGFILLLFKDKAEKTTINLETQVD